jgi:hypothetical protein
MDKLYAVIHSYQMMYYKPLLLALLYWPALTSSEKSTGHRFPSMGISSTGNNYNTIKTLPVYVVSKSLPQGPGLSLHSLHPFHIMFHFIIKLYLRLHFPCVSFYHCFLISLLYATACCSYVASTPWYLGGYKFKYQPRHCLFRTMFFMLLLSPSRQIPGHYPKLHHGHFLPCVFSNSLFINHPIIWCYVLRATGSNVK